MKEIDLSQINLEDLDYLGQGACAKVYKLDSITAIKVLNEKGIEITNYDSLTKLLGMENDTCIFPQAFLKENGQIVGYAMQLVKGKKFSDVRRDVNIVDLINAIKVAEENIRKISEEGILFNDFNHGGLMWDEDSKTIKIIDTDFFEKIEDFQAGTCFKSNIKDFYRELEMELGMLPGTDSCRMNIFINENEEYKDIYFRYFKSSLGITDEEDEVTFTNLIEKIVEIFENQFGIKVQTFGEIEQILKEQNIGEIEEITKDEIDDAIFKDFIKGFETKSFNNERSSFANDLSENGELRSLPEIEHKESDSIYQKNIEDSKER